jgi:hypothetical protein
VNEKLSPASAGGSPTAAVLAQPGERVARDFPPALEYARRLSGSLTAWYDSADKKAQVILTIDGAFLAFLTGSIFEAPGDLRPMIAEFSTATWILLLLMSACLVGSIFSALSCLWSRLYSRARVQALFEQRGIAVDEVATYTPEVMWFFQFVRYLDVDHFRAAIQRMDPASEVEALAFQIHALSANVARKHAWVNSGFVLTGCSLVLFLSAGLSYLTGL